MFGPMNKGGGSTMPVDPNDRGGTFGAPGINPGQPMGGGLAQMFAHNQPAVPAGMQGQAPQMPAPQQVPQITAPQYGPPLTPSPEQAMAATRARMLARTPPPPVNTAPAAAPPQPWWHNSNGGNRR